MAEDEEAAASLSSVVSWAASGAMIFGGVVPYVPQYLDIRRTMNADGFSLHVCLALLLANTLRIVFWFGRRFELPLLLQSIFMNAAMLAMVHLCVRVRNKSTIVPHTAKNHSLSDKPDRGNAPPSQPAHRVIWDFDRRHFWNWTDFLSYVEFLATFGACASLLMYVFLDQPLVVESIGFLAVFVEAMLGVPQFHRNYASKSTLGMSKKMVLLWLVGDIFKTTYFIVNAAPTQFWVCGTLQIGLDLAILAQVLVYGDGKTHL